MRLPHAASLVLAGCALVGSCKASSPGDNGVAGARELARSVVHSAFERGAFQALTDHAIASSFAVAKNRIEGSGQHLTTEQTQRLEAALRGIFAEVYPREAWEEAMLPLFLDGFDRDELQEILAFQRTALGGKLLAVQAQLVTGGGGLGQQFIQSRQEEFSRRLSQELAAALKPR